MSSIKLIDLCKYYKGLSYQMAAISELEEAINKVNPHILGREQAWFKTWSQAGKQECKNPLPTPYQSQRDNYRDAWRTCFSSSCAMLLMTLKPGVIHSDDEYIKTVLPSGIRPTQRCRSRHYNTMALQHGSKPTAIVPWCSSRSMQVSRCQLGSCIMAQLTHHQVAATGCASSDTTTSAALTSFTILGAP